jgi:hypothetical protein
MLEFRFVVLTAVLATASFKSLSVPTTYHLTLDRIPGMAKLFDPCRFLFLVVQKTAEHYHAGPEPLCGEYSINLLSKLFV